MGNNVGDDVGDDVGNKDIGGDNASNDASKGDGGDTRMKWGGLLAEEGAVAAATAAAAATYCWGCFFYIVKIFFWCEIFKCGGNWRDHTSPHTIVTLGVCRHTFGWGR